MKQITLFAVVGLLLLVNSTPAAASLISYSEQALATGTLGGASFTNALVTIVGIGDTSASVNNAGVFRNPLSSATVTVAGIGTAAITSSVEVFDNQLFSPFTAGIGLAGGSGTILATQNAAFASYDLTVAIGPITGTAVVNSSKNTNTSLGILNLTAAQNSTFTAGAPEPGSWMLLSLGLVGVALKFRRAALS